MFILSRLSDTVPLHPSTFTVPSITILTDILNARYANRIIPKLGLCIALYDIRTTSSGEFYSTTTTSTLDSPRATPGAGLAHVNVTFRLVTFRPFKGEVLEGVIGDSDEHGVAINLEFFGDVRVPAPRGLFGHEEKEVRWDRKEKVWIWRSEGNDLYFDKNERVRIKIEREVWVDVPQPVPGTAWDARFATALEPEQEVKKSDAKVAYSLVARMNESGLGPLDWWADE